MEERLGMVELRVKLETIVECFVNETDLGGVQ